MNNAPKKSTSEIQEKALDALELISKFIAFLVGLGLLLTSGVIVYEAFGALFNNQVDLALQDGLFVLILLEMFYVVRSFVRYGSINVSLVVNVGIIAAVKQMIFELETLNMQLAIAFGVIFVTLGFTYFMESIYYKKLKEA